VTIRSTLLGVGAIFWLAALGCWIRSRGSWRLSREGWLFLVLGVPFLVAGWFYTASSYPQDQPVPASSPAPIVTVSTPVPTPPTAATPLPKAEPHTYAEAVNAAQHLAVARYPDLGKAGTAFNTRFVAAYHRLRFEDPNFFSDPDWPLHLADAIARTPPEQP
jgi:hypothetical protein